MPNYDKLKQNLIESIMKKMDSTLLDEWIEPSKDTVFPKFTTELEDLLDILHGISFKSKQLSDKIEEYIDNLSDDRYFYGEKILGEDYGELNELFNKFSQYKNIIDEIVKMGNSSNTENDSEPD